MSCISTLSMFFTENIQLLFLLSYIWSWKNLVFKSPSCNHFTLHFCCRNCSLTSFYLLYSTAVVALCNPLFLGPIATLSDNSSIYDVRPLLVFQHLETFLCLAYTKCSLVCAFCQPPDTFFYLYLVSSNLVLPFLENMVLNSICYNT